MSLSDDTKTEAAEMKDKPETITDHVTHALIGAEKDASKLVGKLKGTPKDSSDEAESNSDTNLTNKHK